MHDFRIFLQTDNLTGADPEISERGGQKPNSRKGGWGGIRLFSAAFSHFLINLLQIFQQRGAATRPAPPLNSHLSYQCYKLSSTDIYTCILQ